MLLQTWENLEKITYLNNKIMATKKSQVNDILDAMDKDTADFNSAADDLLSALAQQIQNISEGLSKAEQDIDGDIQAAAQELLTVTERL